MCADRKFYLLSNNPLLYSDIQINYDSLYGLPINGIPTDLPTVDSVNEGQCNDCDEGPLGNVSDVVDAE